MRFRLFAGLCALLLVALGAPAGRAGPQTPLTSHNVTLLGHIPEAGAIGGHVRLMPDGKRYMLMTTVRGISVYDVSLPEIPTLAGHLELPHFENEDVDFGDRIAIVSVDPAFVTRSLAGLYILDISSLPAITFAYTNSATGNRFVEPVQLYAGHTTTCVHVPGLPDCSFAYVNGENRVPIIDLRDPARPVVAATFTSDVGATHDSQVDASGLLWMVGAAGVAGYDTTDPLDPRLVVPPESGRLAFHHNSWRPRALEWTPRTPETFADPTVRPGETVLVTEENIYDQWLCDGQGRFATFWLRDTDSLTGGAKPTLQALDTWETETALATTAPAPAICSAHYFSEQDGIVAIAWYQQGVRFLDVSDPRDIRQVGYYINSTGAAWDVEWVGSGMRALGGGEIAFVLDAARGIDILRFEWSAQMVRAPVLPEWLNGRGAITFAPHPRWGAACRISLPGY